MNVPEFPEVPDLIVQTSAVSVLSQVSLATMAKAQTKDSVLGLVLHYVWMYVRGTNQRAQPFQNLGVKQCKSICYSVISW